MAFLPPHQTRRPKDRPWRLGWAWGSVCAPRRSSPWRVHLRSHSLHCPCWWLLGRDPVKAGHHQSSSLFFLLLPVLGAASSPHRRSTSLEGPRWPQWSPSAGRSGPAFQPWWQLLFSVVSQGPPPAPRWPSACAGSGRKPRSFRGDALLDPPGSLLRDLPLPCLCSPG